MDVVNSYGTTHRIVVDSSVGDHDLRALAVLSGVPEFEELHLNLAEGVTDVGLDVLTGLPQIRRFSLVGDRVISDRGLGCTQLTDAGLGHLRVLKRLRRLDLSGCRLLGWLSVLRGQPGITMAEIRALKLALPDCNVLVS